MLGVTFHNHVGCRIGRFIDASNSPVQHRSLLAYITSPAVLRMNAEADATALPEVELLLEVVLERVSVFRWTNHNEIIAVTHPPQSAAPAPKQRRVRPTDGQARGRKVG